jgi:hypothetical protein
MSPQLRGSLCAIVALLPLTGPVLAEEKAPVAILELGGAGAWNMPGGSSFGPTAAIEFEPIKNYLLIEAGITPFFDNSGHADWDFDLLFRHPFELSKESRVRTRRRSDS